MASYKLNILRNTNIFSSKDAAIEELNQFEHHSFGQPISLLYSSPSGTRLLFAVGIKNADEETEVKCGPAFYEIINDSADTNPNSSWYEYNSGDIIPTSNSFIPVTITEDEFENILSNYSSQYDNLVFFVEKESESGKYISLYKGNTPIKFSI